MPEAVAPHYFTVADIGNNQQMYDSFYTRGYLVIEKFVTEELCDKLIMRAKELVADFDVESHRTVFSTKSAIHAADQYFRDSGKAISFFLEEEAVDTYGRLTYPKEFAVNKIGHALHDLDPVFSAFSRQTHLAVLAKALIRDPLLLQSMYIFKQPGIGGEVSWHQDSSYLYTEPMSCIGFWFALEDADSNNGGMTVMPGAHQGPLRKRFRQSDGGILINEILNETPWPAVPTIDLNVQKGTLVVLHGLLPHYSSANRSLKSRHAYTLHCIDGATSYLKDNWLQRGPDFPLRGF